MNENEITQLLNEFEGSRKTISDLILKLKSINEIEGNIKKTINSLSGILSTFNSFVDYFEGVTERIKKMVSKNYIEQLDDEIDKAKRIINEATEKFDHLAKTFDATLKDIKSTIDNNAARISKSLNHHINSIDSILNQQLKESFNKIDYLIEKSISETKKKNKRNFILILVSSAAAVACGIIALIISLIK